MKAPHISFVMRAQDGSLKGAMGASLNAGLRYFIVLPNHTEVEVMFSALDPGALTLASRDELAAQEDTP